MIALAQIRRDLHVGVDKRFRTPKLALEDWAKRYSRRDNLEFKCPVWVTPIEVGISFFRIVIDQSRP